MTDDTRLLRGCGEAAAQTPKAVSASEGREAKKPPINVYRKDNFIVLYRYERDMSHTMTWNDRASGLRCCRGPQSESRRIVAHPLDDRGHRLRALGGEELRARV